VALKPTRAAPRSTMQIWEKYLEQIACGAKAKLRMMKQKAVVRPGAGRRAREVRPVHRRRRSSPPIAALSAAGRASEGALFLGAEMGRKFTDNAATTLAQALLIGGTTLTVQRARATTSRPSSGTAPPDRRPTTSSSRSRTRPATARRSRSSSAPRASDALGSGGYPLVRGYDGTVARAWNVGDIVDLRVDKVRDDRRRRQGAGRRARAHVRHQGLDHRRAQLRLLRRPDLVVDGVVTAIADGVAALGTRRTTSSARPQASSA
jgi:hypothetical protein